MSHLRSVSIGLWIDVGSRDERDEIAGAAHFLEHMLFKGTTTRNARDIANAFDAVGGEVNAYSAHEHTCLYARVLDTDLSMAVEILADMFHEAALNRGDLESERRVILEEIHMAADVPEDRVGELFGEAAWPGHPLGRPVLGTETTVGALAREDLVKFYREGYVADRLVVAAAGSLSVDELVEALRRHFRPGHAPLRRPLPPPPRFGGPVARYERRPSEQVHLVWGVEGVSRSDPDRYAQSVLNVLYGAGMSSRLFQEVREKRGLAYSIYSGEQLYLECGTLSVYAGTQPTTAAEVLRIVRDEAAAMAAGEAGEEEVERAKGHLKGSLVLSMDDCGGRMSRLGRSELMHGEVLTTDELLARVEAVGPEDVARVAKRAFGENGAVLACVGPVEEGALDFAADPLAH